ncbi:MAG: hypothetical protein ACYC4L_21190 [Chloroflexota bacterium]
MDSLIRILPLVVVLVLLLPPFRFHVLVAGLVGGIVAALVGGLNTQQASTVFFNGLVQIMSITSVMMFAATAMVLAKAGSISGLLEIIQRVFKDKVELVAAGMVLVQALATYAAGNGAANLLVTAPLIYSVVGFVPALVAALGIVSGATWATSPSSAESAYISQQMGVSVQAYSNSMLPYTLTFWLIGIVLAYWGVRRVRLSGRLKPASQEELERMRLVPGGPAPIRGASQEAVPPMTTEQEVASRVGPWARAFPFLVLLTLIVAGPFINQAIRFQLFTNLTIPVITLAVAVVAMRLNPNRIGEMFIDGGLTILRFLFMVGLFLGFINMLGEIGTFRAIAGVVSFAPVSLIALAAMIAAFLVAIPSAAYTVAIDTLIIPVLAAAGVPVSAFGFVGIAVAQGAMISPVQISVAALAHSFKRDILQIVRNNAPYMPIMLIVTLVMTALVVFR